MFGAVGAFPHTPCRRKMLARLPCAWTLTHSMSFLPTSPPDCGKPKGTSSPRGSLQFLCIWLHLPNGFKNDWERAASTHFIAMGVPKGLVMHWILKSLKWAISVYLNHFFPRFFSSWICVLFQVCSIWNDKLFPCLQIVCRMGKAFTLRALLIMCVYKIMPLWLYSFHSP